MAVLSHPHTPLAMNLTLGKRKRTRQDFHSLHDSAEIKKCSRTSHSRLSIFDHPHTGMLVCSFSRTGSFPVWSHAARRGSCFSRHSHFHRVVSSMFSIQTPEVGYQIPLKNRLGVCIFFPICDMCKSFQLLQLSDRGYCSSLDFWLFPFFS